MPVAEALSLLAPLAASAEGCGLGLATILAAGFLLHGVLPPPSCAIKDALVRATVF